MSIIRSVLIALLTGSVSALAQTAAPAPTEQTYGSVVVKGRSVNAGDAKKTPSLTRKRFYIFAGDLKDNAALVDRIKGTEITSRNCYYSKLNASACFIDWLRQENCETPFCRPVERGDLANVPEFQTAYNTGLPKYGQKPELGLDWIINNLPAGLSSGFYRQQRSLIDQILMGAKPVDTTMTTSTAAQGILSKVPVGDTAAKFVVTNLIPVEVGRKSFVWVCEVSVQRNAKKDIVLSTDPAKLKKECSVYPRDLTECNTGKCEKAAAAAY